MSMKLCKRLRSLLEKAVSKNLADAILLSGGLDTSIIALIASRKRELAAFTVVLEGAEAPDLKYSKLVAAKLGLVHKICIFGESELLYAIKKVIKIMKTFDPMEVRNTVAIYIGMSFANENGVQEIMTGDGADELFGGYSYLFGLNRARLEKELFELAREMRFSSLTIAKTFGINAYLPYLELKEFALHLDPALKVRREKGKVWGKWILRKAYEKELPREIVWRVKTPIEKGSGTTVLPKLFDRLIEDEEFLEKKQHYFDIDKVIVRDKEHLFYYENYRSTFGKPKQQKGRRICVYCNSLVERGFYCGVCGAYPAIR